MEFLKDSRILIDSNLKSWNETDSVSSANKQNMINSTLAKLAIALSLGFIVGIQREWAKPTWFAGIRTIPLLTLLGALCALLTRVGGNWVLAAGLLATFGLLLAGHFAQVCHEEKASGLTSEAACLVMYAVGALAVTDHTIEAIATTGAVAVLLQWKRPLHRFVERIGEKDFGAIIQLVLIGLVILPILPNKTYGSYGVLNPFEIWLMVVLIVGISLSAYAASKFFGAKAGSLLGGALGGLVSSTATTVSYAQRTRRSPTTSRSSAVVIMVASTVVFTRVLFEIGVVAPKAFPQMVAPLSVMLAYMTVVAALFFLFVGGEIEDSQTEEESPGGLKAAIIFGLLYALVLFGVAAAKDHFGETGLYLVAVLSGLTDMDAITLSTSQMVKSERVMVETGWRLILVGALSNMVFKGAAVALLGNRSLLKWILLLFGLSLVGGALLIWLWPH